MIEWVVDRALRAPWVVLGLGLALVAGGMSAAVHLDIEAYPNPVPPLVEVLAQPEGWGAEEVERQVTIPLEVGLAGMPGLVHLRSQSLFGLSDVKCYFDWDTDYRAARQEVINRLQFIRMPDGVQAQISPWNAVGEIFRYTLEGEGYTLDELKTAQDWVLERQWRYVPGVVDVTSYGGQTRQYHVEVDPQRMAGYDLSLGQIGNAIAAANLNVGGQRLTLGEQSYNIRGVGLIRDVHDVEEIVVAETAGVPTLVKDIAEVRLGAAPRLGKVGQNSRDDVVQGIVLMRYGEKTPQVLAGVHARLKIIRDNHLLPPGMAIKPYYDRGDLVKLTTHTVLENMAVGIALVVLVLLVFLGSAQAAWITAINIPLALCAAFMGLVTTGTSANLISLGAVDFGIVVDSTVIMVENIFRHLGKHGRGSMADRVRAASAEVARPLGFSTLILAASFLPLFTMTGVSGVIFAPMARTYAMAIGSAIILCLTLTPVLITKFLRPDLEERDNALMRGLHRLYDPLFNLALAHPRAASVVRVVPIVMCVALFPLLDREFMPKLEEGNLYIRAIMPLSVSMEEASQAATRMRQIVRGCPADPNLSCEGDNRRWPEVLLVQSQMGRPDDGTDVTGFFNIEIYAPLAPAEDFRPHVTKESLIAALGAELEEAFPGTVISFSQMISDNVEEAVSGVKGENAIKIFGQDVAANEAIGANILKILSEVPGVADLGMLPSRGQPAIKISPNRRACARFGLNTGDVGQVVQAALGGQAVTQIYEGEKMFDLTVRFLPTYRASMANIANLRVPAGGARTVALSQVARIDTEEAFSSIYREDGQRFTPIKFAVRGRDLAGAVEEARARIAREVTLPYDAHLEWSGEMNELEAAQRRLAIIVPVSLLLIALLVYAAVGHWLDTFIVLIDIPVACTGGLLALLITGQHFSVSAAMGFVSIFGIAIQDAILVVTYFQRLHLQEGHTLLQAAREAAEKRFRPVLMTTLVATLGLLPAALSHGIGSQTQKPLAIVVIGGSLIVALLTRILQPTLLVVAYGWREARAKARGAVPAAHGLALLCGVMLAANGACRPAMTSVSSATADTSSAGLGPQVAPVPSGSIKPSASSALEPELSLAAGQSRGADLVLGQAQVRPMSAPVTTLGQVVFDDTQVAYVYPALTGRVASIHAELGQHVLRHQPLATLLSPDLGGYAGDVSRVRANLAVAKKQLARQRVLADVQATSEREIQEAENNVSRLAAEWTRVQERMRALEVDSRGGAMQRFSLRAPIDGEVIARQISPGALVQGQAENASVPAALFTIGSLCRVWVMADVFAAELPHLAVGQDAEVMSVAYPGRRFAGRIEWVSPVVDPIRGVASVRVGVDNPDEGLRPGMLVTVRLEGDTSPQLMVPRRAVFRLGDEQVVFVHRGIAADGAWRFVRRTVEVVWRSEGPFVGIARGLQAGETVAVEHGIVLTTLMPEG